MKKDTVAVLITARMKSERFPGKVMADLYGKPMIQWIIEKSVQLKGVDKVVLCTSWNEQDTDMVQYVWSLGIPNVITFQGHPTDLLDRHLSCIRQHGIDYTIDISGDSPFFSLQGTQAVVDFVRGEGRGKLYDKAGLKPPLCQVGGVLAGGATARSYYEMCERYVDVVEEPWFAEQYWVWFQKHDLGQPYISIEIDHEGMFPEEKTPIKTSIDWPLEMALATKICEWAGGFPEDFEVIYEAYRNIKQL